MINLFKKYRAGIGIVLVNHKNQVFIGRKRNRTQTFWQLPQGGIELGETPSQAALRELSEETGITHADIVHEIPNWIYYQVPPSIKKSFWKRTFSGQKQKWFLMRFRGTDKEINLKNHSSQEFSAWKWVEFEEILNIAPSFKQESYKKAYDIFKPILETAPKDNG